MAPPRAALLHCLVDIARDKRVSPARGWRSPAGRRRLLGLGAVVVLLLIAADHWVFARDARAVWLARVPPGLTRAMAAVLPGDPALQLAVGEQQRAAGDSASAAESFRRARQADPGFLAAKAGYANALLDLGREQEAYPLARDCVSETSELAPALVAMGRLHARHQEWPNARALAASALGADPNDADAWLLQAFVHRAAGAWPEALRCARRAAELAPRRWQGWALRAQAAARTGGGAEALSSARRAVALAPGSAGAQQALGVALLAGGTEAELPRAEAALRLAARLDPADGDTQVRLGEALARQKRWPEADEQLRRAAQEWPEQNDARRLLIESARACGDAAGAARWQAEWIRWAAFQKRKAALEARVGMQDYDVRPHLDLARLYAGMGLWGEARREVYLGLRRGPDPKGMALRRQIEEHLPGGSAGAPEGQESPGG